MKTNIIISFVVVVLAFGGNQYYSVHRQNKELLSEKENLQNKVIELEKSLASTTIEKTALSSELGNEKNKSESYEQTIIDINGKVNILQKLSETDKELLQKYSKVYFLNENYTPEKLSFLDKKYLTDPKEELQFHKRAYPYLIQMIDAAKRDGIIITINSAYRSFGEQTGLKANYKTTYGIGANKFSADQGYSEHQLGTALDFSAPSLKGQLEGFQKTNEYKWLKENGHKFGFILSYPEGNTFYVFEPWHWRFVGTSLASRLQVEGKNFYDLEQRKIDEYLIKIFDQI